MNYGIIDETNIIFMGHGNISGDEYASSFFSGT